MIYIYIYIYILNKLLITLLNNYIMYLPYIYSWTYVVQCTSYTRKDGVFTLKLIENNYGQKMVADILTKVTSLYKQKTTQISSTLEHVYWDN